VKFLLDTHLLLWAMISPRRLPGDSAALISDPANLVSFSVASIWEAAIKYGRGRADFQFEPARFRKQLLEIDFRELPVLGEHAIEVANLPPIHKDPFDRILIAQAMVEGIVLLTADKVVAQYPGPIRLV
jgi:PIN domain nuclease of toxin-antitoxin system